MIIANKQWPVRITQSAFGVVLGLCVLTGCGPSADNDDSAQALRDQSPALTKELMQSELDTVTPVALERRLNITGSLAPLNATIIKSKVSGEVLEVSVREGQSVTAGDVLVRLDTRMLAAQKDSAAAALGKARADLDIARLNFENSERLYAKRVLSKTDFDTKRSLLDAAKASVQLAEAQLSIAQIAFEDAVVKAPFTGTLSRRMVDPGGKASPDTPLVELVDLLHMEFQASAPAVEMADVRVGQPARVRVDGYGDEVFNATLERISPVAEQGSRLVLLYLSLDNSDGRLRGGMFAQGELVVERTDPVLAIPSVALRTAGREQFVLVLDEGVLQRRVVTTGLNANSQGLVEVRSGLQEGERVLALRFSSIEPGTPIQVVEQ